MTLKVEVGDAAANILEKILKFPTIYYVDLDKDIDYNILDLGKIPRKGNPVG